LFADSLGTVIGSLLGTSNTTTYVESAAVSAWEVGQASHPLW